MDDPEPNRNIAGGPEQSQPSDHPDSDVGSSGEVAPERTTAPSEPTTRAEAIVDRLGQLYWRKTYGGQDAFACLVRTILSQNTSDKASQPAFDDLMDRYAAEGTDLAETLADIPRTDLAETIASAGLYNQKSATIQRIATRLCEEFSAATQSPAGSAAGPAAYFDQFVTEGDPDDVRETLLEMDGVGPKTADCVLLFAGGQPGVFPVDTHVHRIYRRLGIAEPDADHEDVRAILERDVPAEKCGFGHTASIQFGREFCTARKPACLDDPDACPLEDVCDQVGVSPETGEVVDPAETTE